MQEDEYQYNNSCKINGNKGDKNNNLDIENNISNNIDNKYDSKIKDNNINNKSKGHKISRNDGDRNTRVSLTSITAVRNSNINSNDGSENISSIIINSDSKGNSINSNTKNSENKKYNYRKTLKRI